MDEKEAPTLAPHQRFEQDGLLCVASDRDLAGYTDSGWTLVGLVLRAETRYVQREERRVPPVVPPGTNQPSTRYSRSAPDGSLTVFPGQEEGVEPLIQGETFLVTGYLLRKDPASRLAELHRQVTKATAQAQEAEQAREVAEREQKAAEKERDEARTSRVHFEQRYNVAEQQRLDTGKDLRAARGARLESVGRLDKLRASIGQINYDTILFGQSPPPDGAK